MDNKGFEGQILTTYTKDGKQGFEWYYTEEEVSRFLKRQTGEFTVNQLMRINSYDLVSPRKLLGLEK